MTKRYLVAILALFMMLHTTGCTSGGGQGDGEVAENDGGFAGENASDYPSADAPADGASADAPPADGAENKSDTVAENLDDLGGPPADAPPADGAAAPTDVAANGDAGAAPAPAAGGDDGLSLDTAEPLPNDVAATDPAAAGAAPPADAGAAPAAGAVAANDQPPPTDAPVFNAPADAAATPPADAAAAPPATDVAAAPAPDAAAAPAPDAAATAAASAAPADAAPAAPKAYAPYKKMREQAYAAKDGTSLNRVYVARPGDNMKSISQKIYGKNRKKDLVAWNGKSSVNTGDKIYYASPNDANDTTMKTYYEDIGVQPSTYTSKDGDNIRKVSKQLLGNAQSWKEVWATNPSVESKGDIPAGLEIRYWPEGSESGAVQSMAKNDKGGKHEVANADSAGDLPPPPSDPDLGAPPAGKDLAMNDIPPPAPPTGANPSAGAMPGAPPGSPAAANGMNPPAPPGAGQPGQPGAAAGTTAGAAGAAGAMPPPPPPPPDIPAAAPPEPKPVAKKMAAPEKMASQDSDPDQMMWLGAGGIMLMAAAVLYVVIKKNRAKRVDLSQTQV